MHLENEGWYVDFDNGRMEFQFDKCFAHKYISTMFWTKCNRKFNYFNVRLVLNVYSISLLLLN